MSDNNQEESGVAEWRTRMEAALTPRQKQSYEEQKEVYSQLLIKVVWDDLKAGRQAEGYDPESRDDAQDMKDIFRAANSERTNDYMKKIRGHLDNYLRQAEAERTARGQARSVARSKTRSMQCGKDRSRDR